MAIVHYMHYDKNWYFWIDEQEDFKYSFWKLMDAAWLAGEDHTDRMARQLLEDMFPGYTVKKEIMYHSGIRDMCHYGTPIPARKPCVDENGENNYKARKYNKNDKKRWKPRSHWEKGGSRPIKQHSKRNRDTIRKTGTMSIRDVPEFR